LFKISPIRHAPTGLLFSSELVKGGKIRKQKGKDWGSHIRKVSGGEIGKTVTTLGKSLLEKPCVLFRLGKGGRRLRLGKSNLFSKEEENKGPKKRQREENIIYALPNEDIRKRHHQPCDTGMPFRPVAVESREGRKLAYPFGGVKPVERKNQGTVPRLEPPGKGILKSSINMVDFAKETRISRGEFFSSKRDVEILHGGREGVRTGAPKLSIGKEIYNGEGKPARVAKKNAKRLDAYFRRVSPKRA